MPIDLTKIRAAIEASHCASKVSRRSSPGRWSDAMPDIEAALQELARASYDWHNHEGDADSCNAIGCRLTAMFKEIDDAK